ncbi:MAG: TatD family hydrolase [Campylobacteraceae bacterium]
MSLKPLIIDTHCHLDDERYDADLDEVIKRAEEFGVRGVLIPGADIHDLDKAREIAHKNKNIFYAAGVHPYHIEDFDEKTLEEHLKDEKCIAVGECGLDYYRLPESEDEIAKEKKEQKRVFIAQINLAKKYKKPLLIHIRDANQDSFDILKEYAVKEGIKGVLHCYNASPLLLGLEGFYFGIGGVLTFSNAKALVNILPQIAKEKIILETDAPYLTPMPYRGQRNEPSYTFYVAQKMSEIFSVNFEEITNLTSDNAKTLFKEFEKLI